MRVVCAHCAESASVRLAGCGSFVCDVTKTPREFADIPRGRTDLPVGTYIVMLYQGTPLRANLTRSSAPGTGASSLRSFAIFRLIAVFFPSCVSIVPNSLIRTFHVWCLFRFLSRIHTKWLSLKPTPQRIRLIYIHICFHSRTF